MVLMVLLIDMPLFDRLDGRRLGMLNDPRIAGEGMHND